jgi:hypothetical protein
MKQTDTEKMLQNDPELDALLDQMAEDVPPMPADFHDNWMSAIRTEDKQAAPAAEEKEEKKPVSIVRWTRILSVAAMFVFLISGTLLYRNTKGTMRPAMNAEKKEAAVMTEMAVTAVEEAAEEEAESEACDPDRDAGNMPLSASVPMAAVSDAAAADTKSYEAEVNEAPAMAMGAAVEEDAVYEAAEAAEEPMPVPAATSMPTAEPVPEPEEAGTADEPETTEQSGLLQQAGEFFTDMGDFLLAALPYLAVLAVPAVAALLLNRRKKHKSN